MTVDRGCPTERSGMAEGVVERTSATLGRSSAPTFDLTSSAEDEYSVAHPRLCQFWWGGLGYTSMLVDMSK